MEKISKDLLFVSIFAVVAIAGMTIFFSVNENNGENIIGEVSKDISSDPNLLSCKDSDGGRNYEIKGIVTQFYINGTVTYEDICYSDKWPSLYNTSSRLLEYSCGSGFTVKETTRSCSKGCSNGACRLTKLTRTGNWF
ncbi:MAG: hypothetical protein PHG05_01065 [Candidatus Nanoarchaeia archaeon]|nr:hypothetical protein [Candidatus Nanoarchaeia archaeon]